MTLRLAPLVAGALLSLYGCRARALSSLVLAPWILGMALGAAGQLAGIALGVLTAGTTWSSLVIAVGLAASTGLPAGLVAGAVPPLWLAVEGLRRSGRCRIVGASLLVLSLLAAHGG